MRSFFFATMVLSFGLIASASHAQHAQHGHVMHHGASRNHSHWVAPQQHHSYRHGVTRRTPYQHPGYLWQGGAPIAHDGYGYVHDPYRRGGFNAPDLLEDPLFQAQHKFDSHFPGKYTPQQKLEYQRNAWKQFHR